MPLKYINGQQGATNCTSRVTTAFGLEPLPAAMTDDGGPMTVAELAEYCRTQAGLLSGRVQTIGEEADDLLDEIDDDIAGMRTRLADGSPTPAETPPTAPDEEAVAELEDLEAELESKQALVEAKQARMAAFQKLAAGYVELAETLDDTDAWQDALDRVVEFERDTDAPAYFRDRQTLLEAAAEGGESPAE